MNCRWIRWEILSCIGLTNADHFIRVKACACSKEYRSDNLLEVFCLLWPRKILKCAMTICWEKQGEKSNNLTFLTATNAPLLVTVISLKYANSLRNGANSDTHRCKQLTEHGEERCIKLREVAGFSAVRTIFQIVGPRKILHCLLGKWICKLTFIFHGSN